MSDDELLALNGKRVRATVPESFEHDRQARSVTGTLHARRVVMGYVQCWVDGVQVDETTVTHEKK